MLSVNWLFSIVAQHDFLRGEDLSCLVSKKSCEILSIYLVFYLGEVIADNSRKLFRHLDQKYSAYYTPVYSIL